MKVLHVSTGRALRGGERQLLLLMAGLAEAGLEQGLVAPAGGALAARAAGDGHAVQAIPIWNEGDLRAVGRIAMRARRTRPDVFHLHTSQAHGLGATAARLLGRRRPAVVVTRRVEHSIFRHSFLRLDRLKYAPGADLVLCVSAHVKEVLLADGLPEAMLPVVPDGVDVERLRSPTRSRAAVRTELGVPPDAPLVGSVGQLEEAKGQIDLIRALPKIREAVPGTHLLLVGDGPSRGSLEAAALTLGVEDVLRLPGAREDVPDLLHALDVFAFPSRTEGLGSSVLEAMAAGVPVVASRVGGIPQAIEDGAEGVLVSPGDADALAAAVIETLEDREAAAARASAARRRVESSFAAADMVGGTRLAYEAALSRVRPRRG